jgi:predicted lactoylglutathione lyase
MTMKKKSHMQDAFYQAIGSAYQLNPRKQEKVDSRMIFEDQMSISNLPDKAIHQTFNASRFAEKLILPNDEITGE